MPYSSIPARMLEKWTPYLETLCELTAADAARVIRFQDGQALPLLVCGADASEFPTGAPIADTGHPPFCLAVAAQPGTSALSHRHPQWSGSIGAAKGFRRYAGIMIRTSGGDAFGALDLLWRAPGENAPRDERLLSQTACIFEDQLQLEDLRQLRSQSEAELDAQRERLLLAYDIGGLGVWEYNLDDDLLQCDDVCYRIYGTTREAYPIRTGADFKRLVHPEDADRIVDGRIDDLQTRRRDRRVEFRLISPSGELRWITSAALRLKATDTTPNRLIGMVRDITEERNAAIELRNNYETLRQAERLARMGSWTLDLATNQFISSEMMYELNGKDPNGPPLAMEDLADMFSQKDFERISNAVGRCIETGEPYDIDAVHYHPDGSFLAHIQGQARRDQNGHITALSGMVQDITEREEERKRFEALADNLPSGAIYRLENDRDDNYRLTYISAGVIDLLGIPAAAIVADRNNFLSAIHPDDRPRYLAGIERSRATNTLFDHAFRALRPDGTISWIRCRSAPRHSARGMVWDGIMLDITRERATTIELYRAKEAAEAGERAKADFLATMSHEIRTPMNTVIGMTRLVMQTDLSDKQRDQMEKISMSAKALLSIINNILDFSKIEAGMLALEETEFQLEEMLETVSAVTAIRAEEKGLEIAYSVAPGTPQRLRGDPLRLGQVLINLVSNAIKFTENGEVIVRIGAAPSPDGGGVHRLSFSVRDTGIGIPPEQVASLFKPFSQAQSQITRHFGGTGLGLAISQRLVRLMGGEISVDSQPGRGSTFSFTILLKPGASVSEKIRPHPGLAGCRVLIVDDNASARDILSEMIRSFGMQADTAPSGPLGLEALRHAASAGRPYKIVLMDWRMPDMDGLEVARRIREEEHLGRTPAVLMVTAYGRDEVVRQVERLGLQGLLIKPITQSLMFNTLASILDAPAAPQTAAWKTRTEDIAAPPILAGRKVLVVDDNALNRDVASEFLELAGMRVSTAENGIQAIHRMEEQNFDVILMDLHMPQMDGITATRMIRQRPEWRLLPILALTAQARPEDRSTVEAAGMNGHITKPIDEKLMYQQLARALGDHGASGTARPANANAAFESRLDTTPMRALFASQPDRTARIFNDFIRDFGSAPERMERLAAASDWPALTELAHTLKGSIGYLGIDDLGRQAGSIEQALRHRQPEQAMALLGEFTGRLRTVLDDARAVLAERESQPPQAGTPLPARLDDLPPLLEQTRQLIRDSDYGAMALLEELGQRLRGSGFTAAIDQVRQHFDDLESEAALLALEQLDTRLRTALIERGGRADDS